MKSNRKRPKVARTTTASDEPEEDRLSSFPDGVLCHILSFLPTKYAAITSLLSTRWRYLFLGVPKIDLDDSLLLKPKKTEQGSTGNDENHDFIDFVNRRLMLCKTASITEFRLKCQSFPRAPVFNLWLTTLLFRNVKVLEIEVQHRDNPPLGLPGGIFLSETLVVLKLYGHILVRIPEFVCLRNLKVLNLEYVNMLFESNNFRLAEGYPLLEELRLEGIMFQNNKEDKAVLGISMGSLKKLAIVGLHDEFSRVDIETPHLQHLKCRFEWSDISQMKINFCRSDSLLSADLSYENGQGPWLLQLLSNLNTVKELHITERFTMDLHLCVDSLPQFPNLTYLDIGASGGSLWGLLQAAPNLKTLVCYAVSFYDDLSPPENEPLCLIQTLTEIRITAFEAMEENENVFTAIRLLLEHAAVLEKMIIEPDSMVQWTNFKQLLKQRRRSPKCEVEFINVGNTNPIIF